MLNLFAQFDARPRTLFLDMNAFYCSVEQQECDAYRDKPLIVVPVHTEATCAIAANYEAKRYGIRTGTSVPLARIACRDIQIVEARPELYLQYHYRLVNLLQRHFANVKVLSVDEMACRIPLLYKSLYEEERLAHRVKAEVAAELGPYLRCSIGIGPNVFLAKVASDRQKPDGLTLWNEDNLPEALFPLKLGDLPGIGAAMKRRLAECGIVSVEGLWNASPLDLRRAWKSVLGERWYYMLRGSQEADYQPAQQSAVKKSVGHSNVLAPEHRTLAGARQILLELFSRALQRLRAYGQAAGAVQITIKYRNLYVAQRIGRRTFAGPEGVWQRSSRKHLHANDEATWLKVIRPMLEAMPNLTPAAEPSFVSITFSDLKAVQDLNLSLFEDVEKQQRLAQVIDDLNRKRDGAVQLAGLHRSHAQAPKRIPYGAPDAHRQDFDD
jgi:DNA polymerase-4